MLTAVRELQIPLLAALLLGGCAVKAWRVLRERSITAALDVTGLLPLRLRRPIMMTMCATELALGLALIATAGRIGAARPGLPATLVRAGTALFFLVAVATLNETRQRRPGRRLRLFRRIQRYPDRVADHHPGRGAVRGRRRHDRPSPAPHAVLSRHGRTLAGRAGLRAVPDCVPVAGTRRDPGQARLLRAVRAAPAPGRPHADRVCTRVLNGAGTQARSPQPPRPTCGGKAAGGSWCTRGWRAAGGSTLSSPSTFRPAGPRSARRSSTRPPTRSSGSRSR